MYTEVKIKLNFKIKIKFCEFVGEHAMNIINIKKKKMKLLTKEQEESYENAEICYIFLKNENKYLKDENIIKLEIIVII